jgi:hypothetical protein
MNRNKNTYKSGDWFGRKLWVNFHSNW